MPPFLDVSDLLTDPEIAGQTFTVIRKSVTAGQDGQSVTASTTISAIGSIQPAKSADLQRLPEGDYQKGAIKVKTTFRLTSGGGAILADVIRWPADTGPRYLIQTVDDWTQFGAGFVDALATLADINP